MSRSRQGTSGKPMLKSIWQSRQQHKGIIGRVQTGKTGLGWGEAPWVWSKASRKERKELVTSEVTRIEDRHYKIMAVAQGQQGG